MSQQEYTLRALASGEKLWANICRRVANKFAKLGKENEANEWVGRSVAAVAKRARLLKEAKEVHSRDARQHPKDNCGTSDE